MPRYKITIEYDGTPFAGWQIQATGPSIQGELARAIEGLCGVHVVPRGAGRTDAGVHGRGQVAHFDLGWGYRPEIAPGALNHHLRFAPLTPGPPKPKYVHGGFVSGNASIAFFYACG